MTYVDTADLAGTSPSQGAAMVGFLQSGTGAVGRMASEKMREVVSVCDFGALANGANDTAAIQAALNEAAGGALFIPSGTYMVGPLTVPDDTLIFGEGHASVLKKRQNGDMLTLGARSVLRDFVLEGQGEAFSGRGVLITSGNLDNESWRRLTNLEVLNMADHCVEFTQPRAGYSSHIEGCRFTLAGAQKFAIGCVRLPDGEYSTLNGNRFMSGCWTFGYRMFDAGECDNFVVTNCQGAAPILHTNSLKISMTNCRVVGTGNGSLASWTIDGSFGTYGNLVLAIDVIFADTCQNVKRVNNTHFGITDNASGMASGNEIYYLAQTGFAPSWSGSGSPSIGNGTLTCSYTRHGAFVHVNLTFIMGSSTVLGAGAWTFSLPFKSNRSTVGKAYLVNAAGTSLFEGALLVDGGSSTTQVVTSSASNLLVGAIQPWAWSPGDKMYLTVDYPIQ